MSVEFEPTRLGRHGRRLDPTALAAVAVVVGLLVAVLKPWGAEEPAGNAIAGASPTVAATNDLSGPRATARVAIPRVIQARASSGLSWEAVAPIIERHEAWGVRAIVVDPSIIPFGSRTNRHLAESWFPVEMVDGSTPSLQVDPGDRAIVGLGVTFPPAHTPLDVRIWRATSRGLDWVDMQAVDSVPSGGAFLYFRTGSTDGGPQTWGSGTYRVDLLVDGSIQRVNVTIPDRFSNVPAAIDRPNLRDMAPLFDPEPSRPDVPVGLFAVEGVAIPLPASEGKPLDEAGAWLDLDGGTGRPPRSFVASAYLPRATRLGVMLAPRSVVMSAKLERLAPEPLSGMDAVIDHTPQEGAPSSSVMFRAPTGTAWTPGIYRLTVTWADFEGLHQESWHTELRPGPVREFPPLLAAARGWARYAGTSGVILGTAEPLGTGSTSSPIREIKLRPPTAGYPASTGVGCGGTVIEESPGILGFAYPSDRGPSVVDARIERPFLRRDDQALMTANPGVPGLVLAAPARIASLPGADWVFTVRAQANDLESDFEYALCLGMSSFGD